MRKGDVGSPAPTLIVTRLDVEKLLNRIGDYFISEARLTLCVRLPGNTEADVMFTADDLAEVRKMIDRCIKRGG